MPDTQINLTGWQAIVVLVVLAIILMARLATFNDATGDEGLMQSIETQLMSEHYPDMVEEMRAALESDDSESIESVIASRVTIHSVKTSFPLFSFASNKEVVVKVSHSRDDDIDSGEQHVTYYLYQHGALMNAWQYQYETNALKYYFNFL